MGKINHFEIKERERETNQKRETNQIENHHVFIFFESAL